MIVTGTYDHQVLLSMGATRVADTDEGVEITPDIDLSKYAEVAATFDSRESLLAQILALEATVSPRRLREAVLQEDNGWLKTLDGEIAALRAKLPR